MNTLAYVKIKYTDHTYTATVQDPQQLENYLSRDTRKFKIVDTKLIDPAAGHKIASMLNRISRFGHSLNKTATC